MMTVFDRISAVFAAKKTPAADALERLLDEARRHLAGCEAALEVLEASRADAVLGGEEARQAFRSKLSGATADVDDARLAVEEIERRLIARRDADEQGRRLRAYERAQAARDAAASTLQREYPDIAERFLVVLKAVAEADRLVEAANAELPQGFSELVSVEWHGRVGGDRPARIVADELIDLWVRDGSTEPASEELQRRIEDVGGGRGIIRERTTVPVSPDPQRGTNGGRVTEERVIHFERRTFRRVETVLGAAGEVPDRLCEVTLPPLHGGSPPIWNAMPGWSDPDAILGQIAALNEERRKAVPQPEPRRVVRFELISEEPTSEKDRAA